jgi:hypothetical protein
MAVAGPVADVVQVDLDQAALPGLLQDAGLQVWLADFGEESKDIEAHGLILTYGQSITGMKK